MGTRLKWPGRKSLSELDEIKVELLDRADELHSTVYLNEEPDDKITIAKYDSLVDDLAVLIDALSYRLHRAHTHIDLLKKRLDNEPRS